IVAAVEPGSPAERAGLRAGQRIVQIDGTGLEAPQTVKSVEDAEHALLAIEGTGRTVYVFTDAGSPPLTWTLSAGPEHSLPIHPAQLYAAIDAGLLCLLLLAYYPYRRRDGAVFALMLTIHPLSRFVQEIIRIDEGAVLGTGLTVSQNISLVMLL